MGFNGPEKRLTIIILVNILEKVKKLGKVNRRFEDNIGKRPRNRRFDRRHGSMTKSQSNLESPEIGK